VGDILNNNEVAKSNSCSNFIITKIEEYESSSDDEKSLANLKSLAYLSPNFV
jgi:hypothetical protein